MEIDIRQCPPGVTSNSGKKKKKTDKKNRKTTSRHQNTVEYIARKPFLFISLKEKLDLTLFSVRKSSYKVSYFQRSPVTRHRCVQHKGHVSPHHHHQVPSTSSRSAIMDLQLVRSFAFLTHPL